MRRSARTLPPEAFAHEPPVAVVPPGEAGRVHVRNLAVSTALSRHYVKDFITPEEVIDVLTAAGVRFLLAGAHAIGGWANEARLTQDVDVLVVARHVRAGVRALRAAFPHLQVQENPVVVRLVDPESGMVVIDVMTPNQSLFKVAMRHTHRVDTPVRAYLIPSLEFALAMKFAAMVRPLRKTGKKLFDAGDFAKMVEANAEIDLVKLARLGERVYPGGGREIVEMVRKIRAGEQLIL